MENETLSLLSPPPQERLDGWLAEIYGKKVEILERRLLRHRDLSYVERLKINDAVPVTLIYKVVLPPWDVEQDLHEHILIPSVSNSARLYLAGNYQGTTALFMEDLGERSLLDALADDPELPSRVGVDLAKLHRSFTYRIAEVRETGVLRCLLPEDFALLTSVISTELSGWSLINSAEQSLLAEIGQSLASVFENEPISLVHGDLYAENILFDGAHLFIIDWSWFTKISIPLLDLATLAMDHFKNGALAQSSSDLVEAYCQEYSRDLVEVRDKLPWGELLNRLLFLEWLVERRRRGIMGTTVGPVDILIASLLAELKMRYENQKRQ